MVTKPCSQNNERKFIVVTNYGGEHYGPYTKEEVENAADQSDFETDDVTIYELANGGREIELCNAHKLAI